MPDATLRSAERGERGEEMRKRLGDAPGRLGRVDAHLANRRLGRLKRPTPRVRTRAGGGSFSQLKHLPELEVCV
jgi:hypothetical protein